MRRGRCQQLEKDNIKLTQLAQEQNTTISQLEEDLTRVNVVTRYFRSDEIHQGEGLALPPDLIGQISPETTISSSQHGLDSSGSAETLLPIISRQRERFRQRNLELESENAQIHQQFIGLQSTVESLRSDNVKLYEKIKFLQSYPSQRTIQIDDTEKSYSKQYEDKLDPFSKFGRKERQRKYMNLSPFEKVTLSLGQTVLSNRLARTGAVIYLFLLHCLVFLVLYKMAYTETCKRDLAADCHEKFNHHMQQVHGEFEDHFK